MRHLIRLAAPALALVAIILLPLCVQAAIPIGSRGPAFIGSAGDWISSPPLTWEKLKGKVVLVDFWEYTCVNCIRTYPYLRAWHERYAPYGFVIVGIQTPEFGFSAERDNVAAAAKRDGLKYPVLNDPAGKNWNAYHENYWPSKYIFDQDGKLVSQHAGEGNYQETELLIQKLLHRTHPGAKFPPPLPPQRPGDKTGVRCEPDTPERYANPSYGFLGNPPRGSERDEAATFVDKGGRQDGKIYVNGKFITKYQSLQQARPNADLRDYIRIPYMASEVNVVMNKPGGRDYRVYVLLDGKPIPKSDKGDDVQYDSGGSYLAVTAPRMYNVIRGAYGKHDLKLASESTEFDLYSYTFSGCPQK